MSEIIKNNNPKRTDRYIANKSRDKIPARFVYSKNSQLSPFAFVSYTIPKNLKKNLKKKSSGLRFLLSFTVYQLLRTLISPRVATKRQGNVRAPFSSTIYINEDDPVRAYV